MKKLLEVSFYFVMVYFYALFYGIFLRDRNMPSGMDASERIVLSIYEVKRIMFAFCQERLEA